jgi:hypothetical protein
VDASVFLNIATILYTLRISKSRALDGSEIVPVVDYSGLVWYVLLSFTTWICGSICLFICALSFLVYAII